ncbi:hypothetical protein K449DRAFT_265876 [Hypoxylon sp. EC38]|nr:hypothetical protein K449DRAFT_265876 [Hypoxylon sp. EC38]
MTGMRVCSPPLLLLLFQSSSPIEKKTIELRYLHPVTPKHLGYDLFASSLCSNYALGVHGENEGGSEMNAFGL